MLTVINTIVRYSQLPVAPIARHCHLGPFNNSAVHLISFGFSCKWGMEKGFNLTTLCCSVSVSFPLLRHKGAITWSDTLHEPKSFHPTHNSLLNCLKHIIYIPPFPL